ncbi:hypothetical protein BD779DRAFT_1497114 [Infundibulicybe gibba]|nr:hypothetical protein BD779DRAFT_1497114 [Infundibulicybe gibba]
MRTSLIAAATFVLPALAANHFAGIATSNSKGGTSTYTCRTQADWNNLANTAKASGFTSIRVTGFDCNALDLASSAAAAAGMTVLAGIFVSVSFSLWRLSPESLTTTLGDNCERPYSNQQRRTDIPCRIC